MAYRNIYSAIVFFVALFFSGTVAGQTTLQANRVIARDSFKLGTRWIYLIETDASFDAATNRSVPTTSAVRDFVLNSSVDTLYLLPGSGVNPDTLCVEAGKCVVLPVWLTASDVAAQISDSLDWVRDSFTDLRVAITALELDVSVIESDITAINATLAGVVDGSGTAGYVVKWQDANTVTNSLLYDSGTYVGLGTASPGTQLHIRAEDLGTTQTNTSGLLISTSGVAASAAQKYSGAVSWEGFGYGTTAGTSQSVRFRSDVRPVQGAVPTGCWNLGASIAGGSYTENLLTVGTNGRVGIGTASPSQQLEITGNFRLPTSSGANPNGVIYKGANRFISDFNIGNNGTVTVNGLNTFVGVDAGNLTMGTTATLISHSSANTAVGNGAFKANTLGSENTAIGVNALDANTTGGGNNGFGLDALGANTSGLRNVAMGRYGLALNTTGSDNTGVGGGAGYRNTSGSFNVAIGSEALFGNTTTSNNVAIGKLAGAYLANGSTENATPANSIFIGADTKALSAGNTNQIVIGYNATGLGSNTMLLGNSSIVTTEIKGAVGIGTASPALTLDVRSASANTTGVFSLANTTVTTPIKFFATNATPQSAITASPGDIAFSNTGAAYIKESGSATNTGWAKFATETDLSTNNGIISALPLGNVSINSDNYLQLGTTGQQAQYTGSGIYALDELFIASNSTAYIEIDQDLQIIADYQIELQGEYISYRANSLITGAIFRMREANNNGVHYVSVEAPPSLAGNTKFAYPTTNGSSGYVLQGDGTGITSWQPDANGIISALPSADVDIVTDNALALEDSGGERLWMNSLGLNIVSIADDASLEFTSTGINFLSGSGAAFGISSQEAFSINTTNDNISFNAGSGLLNLTASGTSVNGGVLNANAGIFVTGGAAFRGASGAAGEVTFSEPIASGVNTHTFKAAAMAADMTTYWPTSAPATENGVWERDAAGNTILRATVYGSVSGTPDGSGDITVSHSNDDGTFNVDVTLTGTGTNVGRVQVHTKTTTNFKIRFFDVAGAVVTSGTVTADYTLINI